MSNCTGTGAHACLAVLGFAPAGRPARTWISQHLNVVQPLEEQKPALQTWPVPTLGQSLLSQHSLHTLGSAELGQ